MAVLKASTDKDCEFSTCVSALKRCDHVTTYLESDEFEANKLPINQVQCAGVAAANCHHVHHFEDVDARDMYDLFYKETFKVKNIAILSFAKHAQTLLVDYIRNVLKQPGAANWFLTCNRGLYCLAHAGYGDSNNNVGVEVDWRDVKDLLPPSSTIGTFTAALMQYISDGAL